MAAFGSLAARTQIGQLCAARHNIRVAGFQAITHHAANDRSQSCSSSGMVPAAMPRDRFNGECRYSAMERGHSRSFGTQPRGLWGSFLQAVQNGRRSANATNDFGEDVRVDTRAREPEWLEPEKAAAKEDQALSVVEVKDAAKAGQTANVAEKALDRGSTVATSALDKVGDVLRSTGLEINLDLGLKELTIKELELRDLGLVLEVKTKPQPQPLEPQPQPQPQPPFEPPQR